MTCRKSFVAAAASALAALALASTSSSAALLGVDISEYQGVVNFASVKSAGYSFVISKITEGVSKADNYRTHHTRDAVAAGLYVATYSYAHPEDNTALSEVNYMFSVANSMTPYPYATDGFHMMPALDLEAGDGAHVGASSLSAWAIQWSTDVRAELHTTQKPILYVNGNYMNYLDDDAKNFALLPQYFDLWYARPDSPAPTSTQTRVFPTYSFWQDSWTASVSGISDDVDTDQYNGTLAQLRAAYVIPEPTLVSALVLGVPLLARRPR